MAGTGAECRHTSVCPKAVERALAAVWHEERRACFHARGGALRCGRVTVGAPRGPPPHVGGVTYALIPSHAWQSSNEPIIGAPHPSVQGDAAPRSTCPRSMAPARLVQLTLPLHESIRYIGGCTQHLSCRLKAACTLRAACRGS